MEVAEKVAKREVGLWVASEQAMKAVLWEVAAEAKKVEVVQEVELEEEEQVKEEA